MAGRRSGDEHCNYKHFIAGSSHCFATVIRVPSSVIGILSRGPLLRDSPKEVQMSKKVVYMLITFVVVAALSSWYLVAQGEDKDEQKAAGKSVTMTGCLAKGDSPNEFYLNGDNGQKYEVRSDSVPLSEHVGHKVKVTGTTVKESAAEEKEEKGERDEAGEREAANLQVSKLEHLSTTCK
jgi:hypothetical protein